MAQGKKWYKSDNKIICGVCGGLGEYLGVDPNVIRIVWLIFGLSGLGILAYIVACLILPNKGQ